MNLMEILNSPKGSFDSYRSLEYAKFGRVNDATYREADKRLRQMRWIITELSGLCAPRMELLQAHTWSEELNIRFGLEGLERADRIELHTESFYWIAHRGAAAIQKMPGLKSFLAVGVRDVRNRMIEHVDKTNGIPWAGFGWGGPNGPALATNPYGQDKGLFVNAEEFFGEVHRVTSRCIDNPDLIR